MAESSKARRKSATRVRQSQDPRFRAAWIVLSLCAVLALQLWTCRDKLALPFLDTRLHYNYDNALFTFQARNGLRNGDLRSQFGVTLDQYSGWGEPRGTPSYYTDHPFLVKAVFQQYLRIVGTNEWASRSFYFALSFAIAAGVFVALLQTTGSLAAALAGAAVLVSMPLFATYQTCVKFETDGIVVSVWLFVALASFLRKRTRRALAVYGALAGVAILCHWTAALFVGALALGLLVLRLRGRDPNASRALRATVLGAALGTVALFSSMSWLQRGWRPAVASLTRAFATRSAPIAAATWWERQSEFAKQNFGILVPWVVAGLAALLAVRWIRARSRQSKPVAAPARPELLALFLFATLTVACLWLFAFRQGSFVHIYWQLWFCLPIATLVAAFVASLRSGSFASLAGIAGCGLLVLSLQSSARETYDGILRDQLGKPEDLAFLTSLREDRFDRFVFVPLTDVSLNAWFTGPLFEYYTDRAVAIASTGSDLRPGDKLLILRYTPREDVVARLSDWSHQRLVNEKCSQRMCAYDVVAPPSASP
jgi:hypothetical protein